VVRRIPRDDSVRRALQGRIGYLLAFLVRTGFVVRPGARLSTPLRAPDLYEHIERGGPWRLVRSPTGVSPMAPALRGSDRMREALERTFRALGLPPDAIMADLARAGWTVEPIRAAPLSPVAPGPGGLRFPSRRRVDPAVWRKADQLMVPVQQAFDALLRSRSTLQLCDVCGQRYFLRGVRGRNRRACDECLKLTPRQRWYQRKKRE